jgi:hypothetical protein
VVVVVVLVDRCGAVLCVCVCVCVCVCGVCMGNGTRGWVHAVHIAVLLLRGGSCSGGGEVVEMVRWWSCGCGGGQVVVMVVLVDRCGAVLCVCVCVCDV